MPVAKNVLIRTSGNTDRRCCNYLHAKCPDAFDRHSWSFICDLEKMSMQQFSGPRSAFGNVSGYRCVSDCISRGREFDPGPVPYFRGD